MPPECANEIRKSQDPSHVLVSAEECTGVSYVIDIQDYSNIDQLFRVTAGVLQFAGKLMKSPSPLSTTMTALLHRAESLWVEAAQNTLKKDPRYGMWKGQLGLFTDKEGLFCC